MKKILEGDFIRTVDTPQELQKDSSLVMIPKNTINENEENK